MPRVVLITGATDGIGLETARMMATRGHRLLLHGRNKAKLEATAREITAMQGDERTETYVADLSVMADVVKMADQVKAKHEHLDVLLNNAGVFRTAQTVTGDGLDVRFAVNTVAPYLLAKKLLPLMDKHGRIVNLSSAGQAPVSLDALKGKRPISDDFNAYAQSKLAITAWSRHLAESLEKNGPVVIAVNPGSYLASKMVKDGFGMEGRDISIGADILVRASLSDKFSSASGKYWDNDSGGFRQPHAEALDDVKTKAIVDAIEGVIAGLASQNSAESLD
mmetsp:Transcript_11347/g.24438  ORF Transcript_11347/g.24438 Transcript_11347/m.24438 type:complete len:279 (+) Transcript_11347:46-882(+)